MTTAATSPLPSAWKADKQTTARTLGTYSAAVTATEQTASSAMSTTATNGIYNYGNSTTTSDRCVGGISSGSASKSVNVYLDLINNGGTTITDFTISYNVEKYRNGSNPAGYGIQMYYSLNGTTWTSAGANFLTSFVADANNNGFTPAPGSTSNVTSQTLNISGGISSSSHLYLAWNYSVLSGTTTSSAQGLGIDDVSITAVGVVNPTKLAITSISPASPFQNANFSVTVQSQDAGNIARNVTANTDFTLSVATGGGTLGGTFSGTILAGTNSVTLNSVTYSTAEAGVSLTATRTAGDVLSPGTSPTFTVQSTTTPTITLTGTLTPFSTIVGTPSAVQSYTVSGSNLGTTDITITPPADFEIRTGVNAFANAVINLTPVAGAVGTTTIDVRYNPAVAGTSSGNITHVSGVASQSLAVSGSSLEVEPTTQSTVTVSNVTSFSADFTFAGGNGSSRILVVSTAATITYTPADGFGPSGANSFFTSGSSVGNGARLVFAGPGSTVTVNGLSPTTTYTFTEFEYNGITGPPNTTNYLTSPYPTVGSFATTAHTPVPVPMASQGGYSYTENFADIANWGADFNGGAGALYWSSVGVNATGVIPDGVKTTISTAAFATSTTSGGVQKGSTSPNPAGTIVLLSTGGTDNSAAVAIDFLLDYTGLVAGTLSFDWSVVTNSSTGRPGSLKVYTSTDGTTFTELVGAAVMDFTSASTQSGSIITVALPASFNNSPTARIRFYEYNGTSSGAFTGNRPKIAIDNVVVTGTLPTPPDHLAITNITPASPAVNGTFSVTVQAQDPTNVASNVTANTDVTLQYTGGTGTLSGTLTGTINAGSNSITFTGLSYDVAETFTLTAHRTAGDVLADGSTSVTVLAPVITVTGTLIPFGTVTGTPSASQTYTVSGANLVSGIVITPPQPFEISLDGSTWVDYTSNITLSQSLNVVPTTTIYVQYNPIVAGPNSGDITHTSGTASQNQPVSGNTAITEPTTSSTLTFGCTTNSSIVINFTGGNGSNRIVVMKQAATTSFIPADGSPATGVNSDFSAATDQGSGDKIVYDGNGSTVTVTGLTAGISYAIAVYEYNGTGANVNYLQATTALANYSTNSAISYSTTGSNYTQNFDGLPNSGTFVTTGFGSGPYYLTECPVGANGLTGWQYGRTGGGNPPDLKFNFNDGSSNSGAVYSYGTAAASDRALGSLSTGTTISNFGLVLTNNTPDNLTSITISYTGEQWRNGGGTGISNTLGFSYSLNGSGILSGTYTPVAGLDFTSPVFSTTAAALDGNNPANQVAKSLTFTLNGIWAPGQKLVLRWDDPNDPSNDHGLAIDNFSFSAVQSSAPLTQDHDITFSNVGTASMDIGWTNGDGQNRIVVINTSNSFTAPTNGNTYSANNIYTGTGYGNPGEQVIFNGAGNSVSVSNLSPSTQYWVAVFAYNASGVLTNYNVSPANLNPNSQTTAAAALPDHLVILSVNGGVGVDVVRNQPFSVVVQAQDASNVPQPVTTNTGVDLSVFVGAGTALATGNISGTILAGQTTTTITGVIYDVLELGAVLQADQTSGTPALTAGLSAAFDVVEGANALKKDTVPPSGIVNTIVAPIKFSAIRPDLTLDVNYTGPVTISATGPGIISAGTTTVNAVAGIATFSDIVFNATGSYTVTATATGLSASSGTIYITNPPVLNELVVPQYIGAKTALTPTATNLDRTPIAVCLQIDNLVPNTSYDLRIGVEDVAVGTGYGGSNIWTGAAFTGNIITNAFTTDINGNSPPKWVYIQPATSRFEPAMVHNLRIGFVVNGGIMPTSPTVIGVKTITALDIQSTARTVSTADDGAFLKGSSVACIGGKYILFYDNVNGTGEPLYSYQARQMDATNTQQSGLPTSIDDVFRQGGTSTTGDYAGVIPSNNANGVQRIEVRNPDNTILNYVTDADGVWGAVNTVNPARRTVATLTSSDAPLNTVEITNITSTPESCTTLDGTATVTASPALNANPAGTLSYSWSPSGQTTSAATGLSTGLYTVTVTNSTGGCTATASVTVGSPTMATVTAQGPTSFCAPGSVTLEAGAGGVSWIWYKDNVSLGVFTQTLTVTTSGTYTVTADDGTGCQLTSSPTIVTVNTFGYSGTIFSESMGTPSGNQNVNTYTGWQNNAAPITFTTTGSNPADVRTSSSSTGYTGATGSGNVFLTQSSGSPATSDRNFIISGINTLGYSGITLTFGLRRDGATTLGLLTLEYSTDGITYTPLGFNEPVASAGWALATATGTIPATANLRLKFSKTSSTVSYRIDDVKLTGTTTTVDVAVSGTTNLCPGASVRLTSNIPLNNPPTNVWSSLQTTKSILVSTGGSYSVTVTDVNGCTSTSAPVVVNTLVVDDGNLCTTDACNSVLGTVSNTPVNTDDGNACTVDECNTTTGAVTNTPVNIDDNDPCTTDACDSGTGAITHTNTCNGPTFYAKLFLEGYYTLGSFPAEMNNSGTGGCLFVTGGSLNSTDADNVTISVMNANDYSFIESQTGILKTDGSINVTFSPLVLPNTNYYIRITHRNTLETWSGAAFDISQTSAAAPYDFTISASQAYGNNMSEVEPGIFALYGGDISDASTATIGDQDDIIESQDYGDMENAVYVTLIGYVTEDITGDGIVESADYGLMENNVYFTRVTQRPQ